MFGNGRFDGQILQFGAFLEAPSSSNFRDGRGSPMHESNERKAEESEANESSRLGTSIGVWTAPFVVIAMENLGQIRWFTN